MNHIRTQANIMRYTQFALHGLSPLRSTFTRPSIVSKKHIFSTSQSTGGGGMKKLFVFLCVAGLIASSAYPLFAGGIDNKTNWSAEWVRSLNRIGSTDSADAAAYNPAGVMKLDNGFYLNATGQYALKEYSNTEPNTAPFSGTKYTTDEPDFVPSLFALYKQDKWAAFGTVTIVEAGGKINFENGDYTTAGLGWTIIGRANALLPGTFAGILNHHLEGESYFIGYAIGGAYKINDMVSVSLGARFVDASREFKGYATLGGGLAGTQTYSVDYKETGDGWGGIIGINVAPMEQLNIGLRYETKTSIDLETDVTTDTVPGGLVTPGAKRNRDLPALLGLGVSYKITPKIRVEADLTYYFNEDADWQDNPVTSADETKKDNGYDVGIACEYTFNPKWKASVGYMYTDVGIDPNNMSIETPELDAATFAGGVAFKPTPDWDINLGILRSFYGDARTSTGIFLEKDVVIIALGVQYKFF
jgi:long-chain fatty acid transport protein